MNYIKSFFVSTPQQEAANQVYKYVTSVGAYIKCQALPLTFQYQLNTAISSCQSPALFMHNLIALLESTKNVSCTVKMFTIIHNAIHQRDYDKEELQSLQQLPMVVITEVEENKWFQQFCVSYSSYLKKLPSVCDVYKRAKTGTLSQTPPSIYLIEVFRIINHISLLFPSIATSTNVIGRYYLTSYPQFPQFYRMLNKEITMVYSYMKMIVDQILLTYRDLDVEQLKGFMKTMPEIELTCDKIEDLLLNKYFKGKPIKSKIYLREEKVQEICYYLDYQLLGKDYLLQNEQGETLSTDIRRVDVKVDPYSKQE